MSRVIHVGVPSDRVAAALQRTEEFELAHVATVEELRALLATPCEAVVWSRPEVRHGEIVDEIGLSGVHQLANLLAAVITYGELLARATLDEAVRADLEHLRGAAGEAARILRTRR